MFMSFSHSRRAQCEMDALSRMTLEQLKLFYVDWIHEAGSEKRTLVLSIGPDPILNCLDQVKCLSLDQVSLLNVTSAF